MINTYRHNNINITTDGSVSVKEWTVGVEVEEEARKQLIETASLPFIYKYVAAMPDIHSGKGSTVGSIIPTTNAVIVAAVGADLGCGICVHKTTLKASHLPQNLAGLRNKIEQYVPHGRTENGGPGDKGAWQDAPPKVSIAWQGLEPGYQKIAAMYKDIAPKTNPIKHLGTLGTGNHYAEITIDENDSVWIMLHSGSRGMGNRIGSYFLELAKKEMKRWYIKDLPNVDLAYLPEGTEHFNNYMYAVDWAQKYALENRTQMMNQIVDALHDCSQIPKFEMTDEVINAHHNYVSKEFHFGNNVYITRKGAISARKGQLGIIPSSMGGNSYIVRGLGNEESFMSASHGAGRRMSRTKAKATFTLEDHIASTAGVECRKDIDILDETPLCYKNIEDVMAAQKDLVEPVHTLRQVICVKG
jgi:tRNA-splicing ligase RtcB (3'-phosphate/5'-hydroxy nucleic acid ligase)